MKARLAAALGEVCGGLSLECGSRMQVCEGTCLIAQLGAFGVRVGFLSKTSMSGVVFIVGTCLCPVGI